MWMVNICQIDQSLVETLSQSATVHHRYQVVTSRDQLTSLSVDDWGMRTRPFAQRSASCLLVVLVHLRIHKTRRSLATDHDLFAIHMPQTRFIHTSRLHIVTSAALSPSALIRSSNEPRYPLARHTLAHLTLPIVWFVRASKRALVSLLNIVVISVCLCTSCSARCLPDALLFTLCDAAAATLIALHIWPPTLCRLFLSTNSSTVLHTGACSGSGNHGERLLLRWKVL